MSDSASTSSSPSFSVPGEVIGLWELGLRSGCGVLYCDPFGRLAIDSDLPGDFAELAGVFPLLKL